MLISCTIYHSVNVVYNSLCLLALFVTPRLKRGLGPLSFGPASPGAFYFTGPPVGRARINLGFFHWESRRAGHRSRWSTYRVVVLDLFVSAPVIMLYTTINVLLPCFPPCTREKYSTTALTTSYTMVGVSWKSFDK